MSGKRVVKNVIPILPERLMVDNNLFMVYPGDHAHSSASPFIKEKRALVNRIKPIFKESGGFADIEWHGFENFFESRYGEPASKL